MSMTDDYDQDVKWGKRLKIGVLVCVAATALVLIFADLSMNRWLTGGLLLVLWVSLYELAATMLRNRQ